MAADNLRSLPDVSGSGLSVSSPKPKGGAGVFKARDVNNHTLDKEEEKNLAILTGGYEETTVSCNCRYYLIHPHKYAHENL